MSTFTIVMIVILVILIGVLVGLYIFGKKAEKKQAEQQEQMAAAAQVVSMLIIDKKKLRLKEAGLPQMVVDNTPKYLRRTKVPVVKAKIGAKIMTLMCENKVFEVLPVKKEVKAVVSGLYITEIKSVRGGIPPLPEKKKFLDRFRKKKGRSEKERIIKDSASSGGDLQVMRFLFSRAAGQGLALTPGPFPAGYPRWSSLFPSCPARRSHPYGAWSPPAYCR